MYINIAASRFLMPIHCTHTEIFLKKAKIISIEVNVTFEEYDEVMQYDPKDAPKELGINEDWKL